MFTKAFSKIAGWESQKGSFPHGIVDRALRRYNEKILAKHTRRSAMKTTVKNFAEKAPDKMKMIMMDETTLKKLMRKL